MQFIETFSFDLRLCGSHLGGHQLEEKSGFVVWMAYSPPTGNGNNVCLLRLGLTSTSTSTSTSMLKIANVATREVQQIACVCLVIYM